MYCYTALPQQGLRFSDEAAIHALTGCKGASGLKPCIACYNGVGRHADARQCVARAPTPTSAVYVTEPNFALFRQFNLAGLLNVARTLGNAARDVRDGRMTKANRPAFGNLQPCAFLLTSVCKSR